MPDQTVQSNYGPRDLLLALPFMGTAVAITYDVGYFWGLDIKTFTLFSLGEHIVFALEAVPFALAAAAYLFFLITDWKGFDAEEYRRKLKADFPTSEAQVRELNRRLAKRNRWALAFALLVFAFGAGSFVTGGYAIGVVSVIPVLLEVSSNTKGDVLRKSPTIYVFASLAVAAITFATGYQMQAADKNAAKATHELVLQSEQMIGALVRSGERGLLFVRLDNRQLVFAKWDQIKSLRSVVTSTAPAAPTTPSAP